MIDYTEQVYFLTCAGIAMDIQRTLKSGSPEEIEKLSPEAIAWANRVEFLPHVNVEILGNASPQQGAK